METNNLRLIIDAKKIERAIKAGIPPGRLRNSVKVSVDEHRGKVVISLEALDYFKYYDNGRGPGKFPPPQKIADWVRSRFTVGDKELKTLTYLISRKIAKKGMEGKHLIDKLKIRYDWEVNIDEISGI